jgi:transcriptional regulator with XRE-family HTH domain
MVRYLKSQIGLQVRAARRQQGLTQERLAELIGRTPESVSNIERGFALPSIETLDVIAQKLGVPLAQLVSFPLDRARSDRARTELAQRGWSVLMAMPFDLAHAALGQLELLAAYAAAHPGSVAKRIRATQRRKEQ